MFTSCILKYVAKTADHKHIISKILPHPGYRYTDAHAQHHLKHEIETQTTNPIDLELWNGHIPYCNGKLGWGETLGLGRTFFIVGDELGCPILFLQHILVRSLLDCCSSLLSANCGGLTVLSAGLVFEQDLNLDEKKSLSCFGGRFFSFLESRLPPPGLGLSRRVL